MLNLNRGSIITEFSVIMVNADAQKEIPYVDCLKIPQVNYSYLEQSMKVDGSYFWGLRIEKGVIQTVDLTLPLTKDLDGFAVIHKSNKIFREAGDVDHYEFGKAHVIKSVATIFPESIAEKAA